MINRLMRYFLPKIIPVLLLGLLVYGGGCDGSNRKSPSDPGVITVSNTKSWSIGAEFYGQNYWDWAYTGIKGTETVMANLRVNVYRAGGTTLDRQENSHLWTTAQVDDYIAYCRAINAEPLLTVPVIRGNTQEAAAMVNYCNIQKNYHVKYWIIGNEPEFYSQYIRETYTINDYVAVFKNYVAAMKQVDPSIKIMGPEVANEAWMAPFLSQCANLVDIVSFHYYPFGNRGDFTITKVVNDESLRGRIFQIRQTVDTYCGSGKPIALTETHSSWSDVMGEPAAAETFYSGLWVANAIGISLQGKLWTVALWGTNGGYGTGFLDAWANNQPRPAYYAMQMFTTHFGNRVIGASSRPELAVYASRNQTDNRTVLIVINKSNANWEQTVRFTNFKTPLSDRQYTFPAYSLTCLAIPDDGSPMDCWSYTKDLADRGSPPAWQSVK